MEKIVQGDSISRDVTSTTIPDFTGWEGVWAVCSTLGGTPLKTGAMSISADKSRMECRIPPYDGADVLPLGTCYLELQVSNTSLSFRKTLTQEKIQIVTQGILT